MKIRNLLKLSEDYHHKPLDDMPDNFPSFPDECSAVIGTMDAKQIWGSRELEGWEIYGFKKDNKCIAYIIIKEDEFAPKTHHFREIWVNSEHRGKGLASALILFLLDKLKLKLLIPKDEIVGPMIRITLEKLIDKGKIVAETNDDVVNAIEVLQNIKPSPHSLLITTIKESEFPIFGHRYRTGGTGRWSLCEMRSIISDVGDFEYE